MKMADKAIYNMADKIILKMGDDMAEKVIIIKDLSVNTRELIDV